MGAVLLKSLKKSMMDLRTRVLFLSVLFTCFVNCKKSFPDGSRARVNKAFSLFSIVQFPNIACGTSSSTFTTGTCLATSECTDKGGTASGNCASGFGVCCVFSTSTCASSLSENCSYVTNPGYPNTYSTTGTCKYTINKCASDICQIRLDFILFKLNTFTASSADNTRYGCCGSSCTTVPGIAIDTDGLTAKGQTGRNPPVICGINTGYHMYLDIGGAEADTATLEFYLGQTGTRSWNVKVSQIACTASWRAPASCPQYFTGPTGTVQSYAFKETGQLLTSQQYANCVRQEEGMCSIVWQESSITSPDPFYLMNAAIASAGESAADSCLNIFIRVQNAYILKGKTAATTGETQFCGEALGYNGKTESAPLTSTSLPFQLGVWTDSSSMESSKTSNDPATGFSLDYIQKPC